MPACAIKLTVRCKWDVVLSWWFSGLREWAQLYFSIWAVSGLYRGHRFFCMWVVLGSVWFVLGLYVGRMWVVSESYVGCVLVVCGAYVDRMKVIWGCYAESGYFLLVSRWAGQSGIWLPPSLPPLLGSVAAIGEWVKAKVCILLFIGSLLQKLILQGNDLKPTRYNTPTCFSLPDSSACAKQVLQSCTFKDTCILHL